MPASSRNRCRVGLLLYPGCLPAGLMASADLLAAANLRAGAKVYDVRWVAEDAGGVETTHGLTLPASHGLAEAGCDVVLVPGFWAYSAAHIDALLEQQSRLAASLRALPPATVCWAYCTGVPLLAASGRLRGRSATATWWAAPWLTAHHSRVDWQWQHSLVADRKVVTASGTHGYQSIVGQDIARRLGADIWRDVERFAVLPRPQPTVSVFQRLDALDRGEPWLARLHALVEGQPADQLRLLTLAKGLSTSSRSLARKVRAVTGHSVGEHVRLLKLRQAGERLLHSAQTVAQVSDALGFANESGFRRSFKRVIGMTPGEFVKLHGTGGSAVPTGKKKRAMAA